MTTKRRTNIKDKLKEEGVETEQYITSLYEPLPQVLSQTLEKEQSFLQIPLSQAKFLEFLVKVTKSKTVLEIGTFRGFSTSFLATNAKKVTTIERDERRYEEIEALFKALKLQKKITLKKGFAKAELLKLKKEKKKFDFFFIDADKTDTFEYLTFCFDFLSSKFGVFVVDNTLWAGEVAKDNPASNQAKLMKTFNQKVFQKFGEKAFIFPLWDGITVVVKG